MATGLEKFHIHVLCTYGVELQWQAGHEVMPQLSQEMLYEAPLVIPQWLLAPADLLAGACAASAALPALCMPPRESEPGW
jgi:hypothetical protein